MYKQLILVSALLITPACTGEPGATDGSATAATATSESTLGSATNDATNDATTQGPSTGSGEATETGDTSETGDASDTSDTSDTGDTSDTSQPLECSYGLGAGGLTFSAQLDDPLDQLLTESDRPETGEVYCLVGSDQSVVMVPGLGLSHYVYLTTPDRRAGWASLFANANVSAHVLNPARNLTTADDPEAGDNLSMWAQDDYWSKWGFGPANPEPYPEVRFPVADIDDFNVHMPQYGPGPGGMSVSQAAIDELTEVMQEVGPAVLLVHSAAGPVGFAVAFQHPELVEALVVVEPTGCPVEPDLVPQVPFLAIYGDYVQQRGQTGRFNACQTTRELVAEAGFAAEFFSYPAMDVFGNTHLLMQDNNNHEIQADVYTWLENHVWGG